MSVSNICFNRLSIGALPTAYYESLSYEEQVLWIQKKINDDIIPALNQVIEDVAKIDINFDEINEKITALQTSIASMQTLIDTKASKTELATAINDLDTKLSKLISDDYTILKAYVDSADSNLQYQIDHFDAKNVQVIDPTTGVLTPIQQVIYNIYDQTRDNAITTYEFDALELTAEGFDDKEISAFDFDQNGKTLLES